MYAKVEKLKVNKSRIANTIVQNNNISHNFGIVKNNYINIKQKSKAMVINGTNIEYAIQRMYSGEDSSTKDSRGKKARESHGAHG